MRHTGARSSRRHTGLGAQIPEQRSHDSLVRTVIVHYHLYKNAGTSLDASLQRSLGSRWTAYDRPGDISSSELEAYITGHPAAAAISSHNALLPPPDPPGVKVIPVLFIRHPLDRIRSIYDFEHAQELPTVGARMAKGLDLAGYVEWRLGRRADRMVRDFHVSRLAPAGAGATESARALDAIARLPFVGLVEEFGRSVRELQALVRPSFPEMRLRDLRLNRTANIDRSLDARIRRLRSALGKELFERLSEANQDDMILWEQVRSRYLRTLRSA